MKQPANPPAAAARLRRHGPNLPEAALRVHAEQVTRALTEQRDRWRHGFTRRQVIAGAGAVGVASLAMQLTTTRVAFGDPATTTRALIVIFLRGGMDGLSVVVPANDRYLMKARPGIAVPTGALLPGDASFGLHP